MRPTTGTDKVLPGLLAAVVVSIVLGILGMHALSTHGAGATDAAMAGPAAGAVPGAPQAAAHPAHPVDPAHPAGATGAGGGDHGHDMSGTVILCAAMLAATAAALLVGLGARRPPRLWAHVATVARTTASRGATSPRGTGPPPVWEFSVARC